MFHRQNIIVEFKRGGRVLRAIRTRQSWVPGERRDIYFPRNGPRATKVLRLAVQLPTSSPLIH